MRAETNFKNETTMPLAQAAALTLKPDGTPYARKSLWRWCRDLYAGKRVYLEHERCNGNLWTSLEAVQRCLHAKAEQMRGTTP